jgi:hypothetical protein
VEVRALNDDSVWRLELARRYIEPYRVRAAIAVLGGSVAQGVADRWSDIDTIVYWDEIDRDWLELPRAAENGDRFTWVEHYPGNACLEQYRFGTVKADVAHVRLGWLDELIDGTLSGESFDTTSLDVLRGVQESIVLFGEERYEPIRARVLEYPDALRRALVEANLRVTPSWIYDGMGPRPRRPRRLLRVRARDDAPDRRDARRPERRVCRAREAQAGRRGGGADGADAAKRRSSP